MKLTPVAGTYAPTILSDANGSFASYHIVPSTATKVATYTSDINVANSSQFKTSYAVSVAPTQTADSYVGKVKYTVVHPNYTNADGTRETYNIPVNFAGSGVSSVTFTATGYPTRTVSTSGGTANLTAGVQYTVTAATINSHYNFSNWSLNNSAYGTLGSTSTNPTTFTPNANSGSAVLTVTADAETYTVNISNTNTTSGANSITVPYGGSNTVTVTPASGYYLSAVSCPSGYTCTGYNTGESYTAQQTVTVTNNNTTSGGTLAFTGEKPKVYIQDLTLANCPSAGMTVYDKRDENDYTVKLINGQCWMTQNLRFANTSVPSATSNVTADKTLTYYDLVTDGDSGGMCYGSSGSWNGNSNACIKDSGSASTGVWYNYCAATAGTICSSYNSNAASQDICPKNWHLPSGPNTTANTDINKLVGNTTSGSQAATTGLTAFGAVVGGLYQNGELSFSGYGWWWSATAKSNTNRYSHYYNSNNGTFNGTDSNLRYSGVFVRCVRSS